MTTAPAPVVPSIPVAVPTPPPYQLTRVGLRASGVLVSHFVIDAFSFVIVALLPLLTLSLDIAAHEKALLLGLGSICSGLIQPVVAWAGDRWNTRMPGVAGFVVGVLAVTLVGWADSFWELAVLHAVGAAGIGAYHPAAAAVMGRLGGSRRAKFIALFFVAGMVGGIFGNITIPNFVRTASVVGDGSVDTVRGLRSLLWFMPIGLVCAVGMFLAVRHVGRRSGGADESHLHWSEDERHRRWRAVWVLYASNMMRFSVNMALVYLYTEWAVAQTALTSGVGEVGTRASSLNGFLQAGMQVGMGGAGLLLGFFLSARWEKAAFWGIPMLGAMWIAAFPLIAEAPAAMAVPLAIFGAVLGGVGFGACVPVSMSLAQRMLPHRTSLASGLMLGGAWAFAFLGPLLAELVQYGLRTKDSAPAWSLRLADALPDPLGPWLLNGTGLDGAFLATAAALFVAGLVTLALPNDLMQRTHRD